MKPHHLGLLVVAFWVLFSETTVAQPGTVAHTGPLKFSGPSHYPLSCDAGLLKELTGLADKFQGADKLGDAEAEKARESLAKLDPSCITADLKASLSAAFKRLQMFPCDLTKAKTPITVVLSPEFHASSLNEEEAFNTQQVRKIFEEVRQGKALVGMETNTTHGEATEADRRSPNFNLEADGKEAFQTSLLFREFLLSTQNKEVLWMTLIKSIATNEKIEAAWKSIPRPFADEDVERAAANGIDVFAKLYKDALVSTNPNDMRAINIYFNEKKFPSDITRPLLLALFEASLKTLSDDKNRFSEVPPDFKGEFSVGNLKAADRNFLEEGVTQWRNRNMAAAIGELVCQAVKKQIPIVYLRHGAGHTQGSFEILQEMSRRSRAAELLQVKVDKDYLNNPTVKKVVAGAEKDSLTSETVGLLGKLPGWK